MKPGAKAKQVKPGAKAKQVKPGAKATVKPKQVKPGAKPKADNDRKLKKTFRCRSYRMHVDTIHSSKLRLFNDDARYVYNAVVAYLKGKSKKIDGLEKIRIRNLFTISKNNTEQTDPIILLGMTRTPQEIRAEACYDAIRAHNLSLIAKYMKNPEYKTCVQDLIRFRRELAAVVKSLGNRKEGTSRLEARKKELEKTIESLQESLKDIPPTIEKTSNVKFRLKKNPYATFSLPTKAVKEVSNGFMTIYPTYFRDSPLIRVKGLKYIPDHNFEFRWHRRTNSWRMLVPEKIEILPRTTTNRTVVIDPGVRTFIHCLDLDKENGFGEEDGMQGIMKDLTYKIGNKWNEIGKELNKLGTIEKRIERIRKYTGISLKGKSPTEYRRLLKLKRAVELDRRKILNIVDNIHKLTAKFLLDNYDIIVLPKLKTKSIISKEGVLSKKNRYLASLLSHCRFHKYIRWKALTLGKVVIDQDESYTTQTCYKCGFMTKQGGNETYRCSNIQCKNTCGRDAQSCYNIATRYMSDYQKDL